MLRFVLVGMTVIILALAGSTAYLGYDRIASDEDGEPEQQPASEVVGVTPTVGPSVDVDLSRRCYEAWAEWVLWLAAIETMPQGADPQQWLESQLGPGWSDRNWSAMQLWDEICLSPVVVPVPNPVSDIDVLCIAARAEVLKMPGKPPDGMWSIEAKKLTLLEQFVRLHCP